MRAGAAVAELVAEVGALDNVDDFPDDPDLCRDWDADGCVDRCDDLDYDAILLGQAPR